MSSNYTKAQREAIVGSFPAGTLTEEDVKGAKDEDAMVALIQERTGDSPEGARQRIQGAVSGVDQEPSSA